MLLIDAVVGIFRGVFRGVVVVGGFVVWWRWGDGRLELGRATFPSFHSHPRARRRIVLLALHQKIVVVKLGVQVVLVVVGVVLSVCHVGRRAGWTGLVGKW